MRFSALTPVLQVRHVRATVDWYREMLGFELTCGGDEDWSHVTRDDVALMFMRDAGPGEPASGGVQHIEVDDLLALWASLKGRVTVEWEPAETPYGTLEFSIRDPNGHLLSFGQPLAA